MWDANVGTTERVLDAAEAAGTPRIVYVSTVDIFGDTHGREVDETYRRDLDEGFLSCYDETKFRRPRGRRGSDRRRRADRHRPCRARSTAPATTPSSASRWARLRGKLPLPAPWPTSGSSWSTSTTSAAGIVAALDRGRIGEATSSRGEPHHARRGGRRSPHGSAATSHRG